MVVGQASRLSSGGLAVRKFLPQHKLKLDRRDACPTTTRSFNFGVRVYFATRSSSVHSFLSGPAEWISVSVPESWWKK